MATRRSFLLSAGLAPAALSAAPAGSPIAQLKNRRAEAQPISTAERRARIERAQQLMVENKIAAICLAGGTSLNYFSGARWGNSERLFMMIIPARGDAFFVCPGFEEDRAREQIAAGPVTGAHVYTWQEDESPVRPGGLRSERSRPPHGQDRHRGDHAVCLRRQHRESRPGGHRDQRHAGYLRVPHDQEPG